MTVGGGKRGEGLQPFQMLCCCEHFPYCACLRFSLYRWQNEMRHLIISPTCTAGNLSSKQSAVTLWFSEYWGLSEDWAEGKEKNKIEHFGFVNSFFFLTKISFFLKSTDFEFALLDFLIYLINYFNNSNHHKHCYFLGKMVFPFWTLLLLLLVMSRKIVFFLLCEKM